MVIPYRLRPYRFTAPFAYRGFTLIEVLVVLILVAMVSGILFQALERAYGLQRRFGTELFRTQQGQMAVDWYRQTVQGLYPDLAGGRNVFKGSDREFSSLSINPLGLDYGSPTPIRWSLHNNTDTGATELIYRESTTDTPLIAWRGKDAKFIYLDAQQEPHDQWPPSLGLFPQLPSQIQLMASDDATPIAVVATPMGPTEPMLRPQDMLLFVP